MNTSILSPAQISLLTSEELASLLSDTLNAFLIFTIISFVSLYIAWKNNFFTWKKSEDLLSPKIAGTDVLKGFVVFLLMQIVVVPLLFLLFHPSSTEKLSLIEKGYFNLLLIAGSSIGIFIVYLSMTQAQRNFVWGARYFSIRDLFMGIKTWLVAFPLVMSVTQFFSFVILITFRHVEKEQLVVEELKKVSSEPFLFFLTIGSIIFLVPIAEELLFRGLLQNWLKTKMRRESAIGLASLIFAFFHFSVSQGATNIELFAGLLVLSCFLGFLYEKQCSIWAPVGLHGFFNGMSAMMILNLENL